MTQQKEILTDWVINFSSFKRMTILCKHYFSSINFPKSSNIYDSYGEALLQCGKKEDAIKMYQKAIELNPDNENGKKVLKELL